MDYILDKRTWHKNVCDKLPLYKAFRSIGSPLFFKSIFIKDVIKALKLDLITRYVFRHYLLILILCILIAADNSYSLLQFKVMTLNH